MSRRCVKILTGLAAIAFAMPVCGVAGETENDGTTSPPLVTAVKHLPAPTPDPEPSMQMPAVVQREVPKPTTPAGKLPQYQMHHLNRRALDAADPADPRIRLLLALPNAPILVEATITIDGKPWLMSRESRVQDLMKFAADPAAHREMQLTLKERAAALLKKMKDTAAAKLVQQVADADNTTAPVNDPDDEKPLEIEAAEVVAEVAEFVEPASVYERIERYMAATDERPTESELRWLLTDWIDGPPVLLLNDNYQRFRADQRPVFDILDRDRSDTISAEELKLAVSSFRECDLNRDGLVQYTEINEVARDPRNQTTHAGQGKLMFLVPSDDTAVSIYERLAHRYGSATEEALRLPRFDGNKNGRFDPEEIADLQSRAADVEITIRFNTKVATNSRLEITRVGPEFAASESRPEVKPDSLTMHLAGSQVDFTAIQRTQGDQISIGAIDDGYPLLPIVDPNDDGRFTVRELRRLNDRLSEFDANKDGELTPDETRSTIRVCFGLGPLAHLELGSIRNAANAEATPTEPGPDWFVRMDGNKDGDLTREEFLGTDEQFSKYDRDSDDLLSAVEANAEIESR